jgi:hypothetical protein
MIDDDGKEIAKEHWRASTRVNFSGKKDKAGIYPFSPTPKWLIYPSKL